MSATGQNRPSIFRIFLNFIGFGETPDGVNEHVDRSTPDERLYARLSAEAMDKTGGTRKIKVCSSAELVDQLIALMFKLKDDGDGYRQNDQNDIWKLLRKNARRSRESGNTFRLKAHSKIFYTYYNGDAGTYTPTDLSRAFYDRIYELAGMSSDQTANDAPSDQLRDAVIAAMKAFIQNYINEGVEQMGQAPIEFDPNDSGHRTLFKNALVCNFAFCPKKFSNAEDHFIVGKNSIYDIREIKQKEARQRKEKMDGGELIDDTRDDTQVCVAYRYHVPEQSTDGARIQFNAHRFRSKENALPKAELELLMSDVKTMYLLSAGSAEHDEIYCPDWSETQSIFLKNIQREDASWKGYQDPEKLPEYMRAVKGYRSQPLYSYLLKRIELSQFQPKIKFVSRVIPIKGEVGEIEPFLALEVRDLAPVAAVEITHDLWIILDSSSKPFRFERTGANWTGKRLEENVRFTVGECTYFWKTAEDDVHLAMFSDKYAGLIVIEPGERQKAQYEQDLSVDKGAESLPVANHDTFISKKIVNDPHLGTNGVVGLMCVKDDWKVEFAFSPVRHPKRPVHPFFAIKRVVPSNTQPWPPNTDWVVYQGDSDAEAEEKINSEGFLTYDGQMVLAVRSSYLLLCGTSIFQIEISGTPGVKDLSNVRTAHSESEREGASSQVLMLPAPVVPDEENIVILLQDTPYRDFMPRKIGRSDIASHVELEKDNEKTVFLKAFWPGCKDNAEREINFYETYKDRSAELFIKPPIGVLQDKGTAQTYYLLFEKLENEKRPFSAFQSATISQAVALAYSLAVLHQALSDDGWVNFDIDPTNVCFEDNGRICLIDFDNVFPLVMSTPIPPEIVEKVGGLLRSPKLPAKNDFLPPEAIAFNESAEGVEKEKALANIDSSYGLYLIGATILTVFHASRTNQNNQLALAEGRFRNLAGENLNEAAKQLKNLLKEMIKGKASERPSPKNVVERLESIIRKLARDEEAKKEMDKLLGAERLAKIIS